MKTILFISILFITACASTGVKGGNDSLEKLLQSGKDIYIENRTFNNDIDFTTILSANKINNSTLQVTVTSSIVFVNCIFNGALSTYTTKEGNNIICHFEGNVSFIGCTFNKPVTFRASSILGRVNFSNTMFVKTVNFEECTFFQNANFNSCIFHEEARFHNTYFMHKANFMRAEFDKTVFFQAASFLSEAQFSASKYNGYADFSLLSCRQNFLMNYVEFSDQAIFNNSYFVGKVDFRKVKFNKAEFKKCFFIGETHFDNSTTENTITFKNSTFLPDKPNLGFLETIE